MSDVTYRHQLPFSTLAVAEALNPTLYEGEPWTEKDPVTGHSTGRKKVGDGVTAFVDLPFEPSAASSTASSVTFTPAGTIAATNVQAAIQEAATEAASALAAHEAAADPHAQYLTQTEGDARYRQSSTALTDSDIPAGIARDAEVSAAIIAHESASDPHSQYLTQTEGDGRYRQTATALTDSDIPAGIARDSEVTAAITAHESAADPHPGYLTQTEGDGRYRQTATALTDSDIPAGIARDSEVTAAITAHESAADPHPGYLTTAEGNAAYARALTTNAAVTAGTNSQGQAVLTADTNVITSTPNNPSAVTLGTPAINQPPVVVINAGSNPVNVFPPAGVQIDTAGANNPYSLAVGARIDFIGTSATQWRSSSIERTSVSFLAGTGTGVNAALAANVGTAGAFVTFNGAGGTPSAINLANGTALPTSGITNFNADIRAQIEAALLQGTNITITPSGSGATRQFTFAASGGGGATNLSIANRGTTTLDVASDTGTDATIPAATTSLTGLLTSADKTKLDGVATGATANATDAALRDRATHTGTQPLSTTISGLGTGVAAALAVNTGSAGAPVLFNGAGGTPSAITLTNGAGLPWGAGVTGKPTTLAGYGITDAQSLDADLTAIAALTTTTFGRQFLDRADEAAGRTHLGLGTLATQSGTFSGTSSGTNTGDQTISNSSNATSHTVTLSASGGTVQFVEGANITLTTTGTSSAGVVTIAASSGGGSLTVQDEGTTLSTSVTTINFTGAGATATGAGTITVDIPSGGGGGGNAFSTIAVSGQSNVAADSSTDTLTLVAGAEMVLTTNATTDEVTFTTTAPSLGEVLAIAYGMAMP